MKIYLENSIPDRHISHPGSNAATVNKAHDISFKIIK
jgi:hypothetical protein